MANTAQAKKRVRQAEARRQKNVAQRSALRTSIKKVVKAIEAKNKEEANIALKVAQPMIDRMATKRIIHKNKAARIKSRLSKHIKAL